MQQGEETFVLILLSKMSAGRQCESLPLSAAVRRLFIQTSAYVPDKGHSGSYQCPTRDYGGVILTLKLRSVCLANNQNENAPATSIPRLPGYVVLVAGDPGGWHMITSVNGGQ